MSNKNTAAKNNNVELNTAEEVIITGETIEVKAETVTVEGTETMNKETDIKELAAKAAEEISKATKRSFNKENVLMAAGAATLGVALGGIIHNVTTKNDDKVDGVLLAATAVGAGIMAGTTQSLIQLAYNDANNSGVAGSMTGFISAQVGGLGALIAAPHLMELLGREEEVEEVVAVESAEVVAY